MEKNVAIQAAEIQNKIVSRLNKLKENDGFIYITRYFQEYYDTPIRLKLYYDFRAEEDDYTTSYNEEKNIIVIEINATKKTKLHYLSTVLHHEIIHAIDYIKTNFKEKVYKDYERYRDTMNGAEADREVSQDPYYMDIRETNVLINQFYYLYKTKKSFKQKIDNAKTFKKAMQIFFYETDYPLYKVSTFIDNPKFKNRFLKRLYKLGIRLFREDESNFDVLIEGTTVKEVDEIQSEILNLLKEAEKEDPYYKTRGILEITRLFKNYIETINKNGIIIKLYYDFTNKEKITKLELTKDKKNLDIVLAGNKKQLLLSRSLKHELTHVVDILKSNMKFKNVRETGTISSEQKNDNKIVPYLKDPLELNALINEIIRKYKKDLLFRVKFNRIKTYEELLKLIFEGIDLEITKYIINDTSLKKKILSRLARENIIPLRGKIF